MEILSAPFYHERNVLFWLLGPVQFIFVKNQTIHCFVWYFSTVSCVSLIFSERDLHYYNHWSLRCMHFKKF